jgi:hypothetical protein
VQTQWCAEITGVGEQRPYETMKHWPVRRTGELHKGRVSIPGARYFVTLVN